MAYSNGLRSVTLQAAGDLSTRQYHAVNLGTTALQCVLPAANAGYGILQNHPNSGEAATVAVEGETRGRAGATVAVGALITSAATGWLTPVNSGAAHPAGGVDILGRAKTAGASGSVFTLDIDKFRINPVSGAAI